MNKRMVVVLLGCLVVFGGIFGFKKFVSVKMNEFFDHMPVPPATITTAEAKQESWEQTLDAVGTVRATNGINLTSQTAGTVSAIHFQSGDRVKAGDLLLTLDDREDRSTLASLEAAAKLAQQNFERYQNLRRQGSVSEAQLDQARSQRDQAANQVSAQRARVHYKNITAPFDGELGIRQVDIGQLVSPGTTLVSLQSLSPIYVNFSLPEQDLPIVKAGLAVSAGVDSQPGRRFSGSVNAVEPGVDPATRNFNVQARFDNEDLALRPGMFASVSIKLPDAASVVVVPRTAIIFNPYGNAVYVVQKEKGADGKENTFVMSRFVKLGQARGDLIVVTEGLKPGEEVATSGLLKLRNKLPVIIDNRVQPSAELAPNLKNS